MFFTYTNRYCLNKPLPNHYVAADDDDDDDLYDMN